MCGWKNLFSRGALIISILFMWIQVTKTKRSKDVHMLPTLIENKQNLLMLGYGFGFIFQFSNPNLNSKTNRYILYEIWIKAESLHIYSLPWFYAIFLRLAWFSFFLCCFHSSYSLLPSSVSKKAIISGRKLLASFSSSCFGISLCFADTGHHSV